MAIEALMVERVPAPQLVLAAGGPESGRPRVEFAGTLIDLVDRSAAVDRIRGLLSSGRAHQIVTVNLDFLSIASRDARFQQTINAADLAVPDGMPLVWLSRLKGQPLTERVTGVDLVDECCAIAAERQVGVFLLGAAPGVADKAALELQRRHPRLQVVGTYSPAVGDLDERENARIVQRVRDAAPGFLFVALGAPRQDLWIHDHLAQLGVPVAMGVGCVLDLLAGAVTRAPAWMQHAGLEWAYRLAHEPGRLWRRYLLRDLPTLARLLVDGTRDGGDEPAREADPAAALT
jgi:N-acetylglucosaminyldiphosphoundecaprenol N-acetyl-beta-D-mannosaminyltransferase